MKRAEYTLYDIHRLKGSFATRGKSVEWKSDYLDTISNIMDLQTILPEVKAIPFVQYFCHDGDPSRPIEDEGELRRIIFEYRDSVLARGKELKASALERLTASGYSTDDLVVKVSPYLGDHHLQELTDAKEFLERTINDAITNLDSLSSDYYSRLNAKLTDLGHKNRDLDGLEMDIANYIPKDASAIELELKEKIETIKHKALENGWICCSISQSSLSLSNLVFHFTNIEDIYTEYIQNGESIKKLNFGRVLVEASYKTTTNTLSSFRVKGLFSKTTTPRGYPHPHISTTGSICWGEGSFQVDNLIQMGDIPSLLLKFTHLLTNYNPSYPYAPIKSFKQTKINALWKTGISSSSGILLNWASALYTLGDFKLADLPTILYLDNMVDSCYVVSHYPEGSIQREVLEAYLREFPNTYPSTEPTSESIDTEESYDDEEESYDDEGDDDE